MLINLYIKNLAVVEKATLDFGKGMNLFTGETGAGKSIIIGAINFIIGGRCSKNMVRAGEKKAVVVATLQDLSEDVRDFAKSQDWDISDDQLIIQRDIYADGRTLSKVNGMPVNVSILRQLGGFLVNIHGQRDSQILLFPEKHLNILDNYGDLNEILAKYQYHFERLKKINSELIKIKSDQAAKSEQIESISEQIREIQQAAIEEGEDVELESESRSIKNSAKILENLSLAHEILVGNDESSGAVDMLNDACSRLETAAEYYDDVSVLAEKLRGLLFEVQEISYEIGNKCQNLDFNPNKLDLIESRLDEIFKIKRKYGPSISDVNNRLNFLESELEKIELYDVRQNELIVSQKSETKCLKDLGEELSQKRRAVASKFVRAVSDELAFLDMQGVKFEVNIFPSKDKVCGMECVEFWISTNAGEPPKPIGKIASGGELSRIMLAIKNVLAQKDRVSTLIFDEIDTGVSGSAAQKIGLKLKQVSKNRQVFCVTHLAQIAALADSHFKIFKKTLNGRSFAQVSELDEPGRVEEVARIMAAGSITNLNLQTAREMIEKGRKS